MSHVQRTSWRHQIDQMDRGMNVSDCYLDIIWSTCLEKILPAMHMKWPHEWNLRSILKAEEGPALQESHTNSCSSLSTFSQLCLTLKAFSDGFPFLGVLIPSGIWRIEKTNAPWGRVLPLCFPLSIISLNCLFVFFELHADMFWRCDYRPAPSGPSIRHIFVWCVQIFHVMLAIRFIFACLLGLGL